MIHGIFIFLFCALATASASSQINTNYLPGNWVMTESFCNSYVETPTSQCIDMNSGSRITRYYSSDISGLPSRYVMLNYDKDKIYDYELDVENNCIYTEYGPIIKKESIVKLTEKEMILLDVDTYFDFKTNLYQLSGKLFIRFYSKEF